METWVVAALVLLAVALVSAGVYYYAKKSMVKSIGVFEPLTAGVADYFLTNDYWSNHYWAFDYWPAYGTGTPVVPDVAIRGASVLKRRVRV